MQAPASTAVDHKKAHARTRRTATSNFCKCGSVPCWHEITPSHRSAMHTNTDKYLPPSLYNANPFLSRFHQSSNPVAMCPPMASACPCPHAVSLSLGFAAPILVGTSFLAPLSAPSSSTSSVSHTSASRTAPFACAGSNQQHNHERPADPRAELDRLFKVDLAASSDGKCPCVWCSGSGRRACAWCDGNGSRNEFLMETWESLGSDIEARINGGEPVKLPERVPTVCSACEGCKTLRCAYCKGSGVGCYGHAY
jgi:hypothetical protein